MYSVNPFCPASERFAVDILCVDAAHVLNQVETLFGFHR